MSSHSSVVRLTQACIQTSYVCLPVLWGRILLQWLVVKIAVVLMLGIIMKNHLDFLYSAFNSPTVEQHWLFLGCSRLQGIQAASGLCQADAVCIVVEVSRRTE